MEVPAEGHYSSPSPWCRNRVEYPSLPLIQHNTQHVRTCTQRAYPIHVPPPPCEYSPATTGSTNSPLGSSRSATGSTTVGPGSGEGLGGLGLGLGEGGRARPLAVVPCARWWECSGKGPKCGGGGETGRNGMRCPYRERGAARPARRRALSEWLACNAAGRPLAALTIAFIICCCNAVNLAVVCAMAGAASKAWGTRAVWRGPRLERREKGYG